MANWWEMMPGSTQMNLPTSPIGGSQPGGVPGLGSWSSAGVSSPATGSGFNWGNAAAIGIPAAAALFTGSTPGIAPITGQIQKNAANLSNTGVDLAKAGQTALPDILKYLHAITSGDPTALMEATQPERRRVIDQYDTARQTAARTAPRGGGTASALTESYDKEAGDLAGLTTSARKEGVSQSAQLASGLIQAGVGAQGAGTAGLSSVLYPILAQGQQSQQNVASTFAGIAKFIAPLIFGPAGSLATAAL